MIGTVNWDHLSKRFFEQTLPGSTEVLNIIQPVFGSLLALPPGRAVSILRLWGKLQRLSGAPYPIKSEKIINPNDIIGCAKLKRLERFFLFSICAYAPNHPRMSATTLASVPGAEYKMEAMLFSLFPDMEVIRTQPRTCGMIPSHMLYADHKAKELIVTIRGSAEIADWMINLNCRTSTEGTHLGMMTAAQALRNLLTDTLLTFLRTHEGYSLHLCGHSLGGGIASLFAISWYADFKHVSQVRAWSFGAPCVVTPADNPKYDNIVTSVIFGKDVVSRFSYRTLDRVLYVLNVLAETSMNNDLQLIKASNTELADNDNSFNFHLNGIDLLNPRQQGGKNIDPGIFKPSFDHVWKLSEEAGSQRENHMLRFNPSLISNPMLFWRRLADSFYTLINGRGKKSDDYYSGSSFTTSSSRMDTYNDSEEDGASYFSLNSSLSGKRAFFNKDFDPTDDFVSPKSDSASTAGSTPGRCGTLSPSYLTSDGPLCLFESMGHELDPVLMSVYKEIERLGDLENSIDLMPAGNIISIVPKMHLLETGVMVPAHLMANNCLFMECDSMTDRYQLRIPILSLESITDHLIDKYALALCPGILRSLPAEYGNM